MELTAVSATQFSVAQLTTILSDCFEDYGAGFAAAGSVRSALQL